MIKMPIKGLHIQLEGNQYLTYYPQPDITAHELALLTVMWPFFSMPGLNNYDYLTYINSNNLTRHFKGELK
jgi:hypothetical protein